MSDPHRNDPRRLEQRRVGAKARAVLRAARSVDEQVTLIQARPGKSEREIHNITKDN